MRTRTIIAGMGVAAMGAFGLTGTATAAPPGLPDDNPNPNALILPVDCEGFDPFVVWAPNGNSFGRGAAGTVGHPIGVDVGVGVQKSERQGAAFDHAIECLTPIGPIYVMPTGQDRG
jgi:hypothetical protein